ncbi:Hypothetical predicted protein [Podarcis lilfordi]|uniref:Uncharacterized protein n=1 Tax=Podarcis lilfordi TaxID=74358 RepID=A0AA35KHK2_9SAUR|nr:Hypothetical predicted protein [Podarcis lilfordi]
MLNTEETTILLPFFLVRRLIFFLSRNLKAVICSYNPINAYLEVRFYRIAALIEFCTETSKRNWQSANSLLHLHKHLLYCMHITADGIYTVYIYMGVSYIHKNKIAEAIKK